MVWHDPTATPVNVPFQNVQNTGIDVTIMEFLLSWKQDTPGNMDLTSLPRYPIGL